MIPITAYRSKSNKSRWNLYKTSTKRCKTVPWAIKTTVRAIPNEPGKFETSLLIMSSAQRRRTWSSLLIDFHMAGHDTVGEYRARAWSLCTGFNMVLQVCNVVLRLFDYCFNTVFRQYLAVHDYYNLPRYMLHIHFYAFYRLHTGFNTLLWAFYGICNLRCS